MPGFSLPYTPHLKQHAANLWPIIKETASDWMEDNAMRLSAALALYAILSLAPLLLITTKIVSIVWMHNPDRAKAEITQQLTSLMGAKAADYVNSFTRDMQTSGGLAATLISVGVLVFSATGVFAELQDSMNTIWGVKPKPHQGVWNWVRNRLLSLAMVFGIGFLLLVSMFISMLITTASKLIFGDAGPVLYVGEVVISLAVVTLLFAAIFKFLPDVRLTWRHVLLGAAITAVLFTVGKYGLALYFKYNAPKTAYGAAAAPVAVLLWIYYSSFILFFGAEFTKVWSLHHGHRVIPEEIAVKVTEEDRAQRGIPSEQRMAKALAGQPFNRLPPPTNLPHPNRSALGPAGYALAAGGVVFGAIAGGVDDHFLRRNGVAKPAAAPRSAERLKERLQAIEDRLGHVSRIKRMADNATVAERIDRVEREIRRVGSRRVGSASLTR